MGVIRRAALLRTRSTSARGDWLALVGVAALAVVVLLYVSGVIGFGTGPTSAVPPTDVPLATVPVVAVTSGFPETTGPSSTPGATAPPSPSPTASPSATPSPLPSPSPSPAPSLGPTLPPPPLPTPPPPRTGLQFLEPAEGAIVSERFIIVRGLAPPGAIITRDIPFWFDDHTTADSAGRWSLAAQLERGENELTFRIGDDSTTERTLTVHFLPQ